MEKQTRFLSLSVSDVCLFKPQVALQSNFSNGDIDPTNDRSDATYGLVLVTLCSSTSALGNTEPLTTGNNQLGGDEPTTASMQSAEPVGSGEMARSR